MTKYLTGDVSEFASRVPTLYALPTSDGHALAIEVPRACGSGTTDNGEIPNDFFPAVVYYERQDDLSLGLLYLSEDAYEGPLAKLKFHGASISAASRNDFDTWMQGEGKKNLISYISSADLTPLHYPQRNQSTDKLIANPGAHWEVVMPKECYGVARLRMPENLRNYVRQFWNQAGPRYWTLSEAKRFELGDLLSHDPSNVSDGDVAKGDVLFNGHAFRVYRVYQTLEVGGWGTGLITRRGGGSFRAANWRIPSVINALPTDYFPMRMSEGLPWLKMINPDAKELLRDIEIGNESKKGFFYCFSQSGPVGVMQKHLPNFDLNNGWNQAPASMRVDGQAIGNLKLRNRTDLGIIFFDRDEYMLWVENIVVL